MSSGAVFSSAFACAALALLHGTAAAASPAAPAVQPAAEQIARIFADYDGLDRPGCAVGVMRDGRLIHAAGFGAADLAARRPIDARTVFNIASVSKQFTALAVLLLDERGALSLDDPITKHVPELGAYAREVTLRHLLHHVGGLREYTTLLLMQGYQLTQRTTAEQALQALSRQRAPNAPPGVEYDYSNSGYFLLGLVVERVSGKSLQRFSQENLFVPLGMARTTLVERYPAALAQLARPYLLEQGRFKDEEWVWEQTGDGQVYSNIEDLARWEANFERIAIGSQQVMSRMHQLTALASGRPLDYAAGVYVRNYRGLLTVRHSGDWGGYRAHLLRFPQQRLAVSVLCNRADASPFRRAAAVAEIFLEHLMAPSDVPAHLRELQEAGAGVEPLRLPAGLYRDASTGRYVRLQHAGRASSIETAGTRAGLQQAAPGIYLVHESGDMYAVFRAAAAGRPAHIILQDSEQPYRYEFTTAWQPRKLAAYVGSYRSAEANVTYQLQVQSGALTLNSGGNTIRLQPMAENEWAGEGLLDEGEPFTLRIDPSAGGGFRLFTTGVRALEFRREAVTKK